MTCTTIKVGDMTAIVCSRGRKPRKKCSECGTRPATQACDWKMPGGGTCDKPLCRNCSYPPARNKDLCGEHVPLFREWLAKRPPPGSKEPKK